MAQKMKYAQKNSVGYSLCVFIIVRYSLSLLALWALSWRVKQ